MDTHTELGLTITELAQRAEMTDDEIECNKKAAPNPPSPCCTDWPPHSTPTSASPLDTISTRSRFETHAAHHHATPAL